MFIFLGGPPGPSNTRDDKKERVTVLLGPVAGLLIAAPNDTAGVDDWFGAARTALGSYSGSISQPFRAGLTFGGRPSGPCIYCDLCRVISPSTCRWQVSRSGKTKGRAVAYLGL
jgi:hypothetical protein